MENQNEEKMIRRIAYALWSLDSLSEVIGATYSGMYWTCDEIMGRVGQDGYTRYDIIKGIHQLIGENMVEKNHKDEYRINQHSDAMEFFIRKYILTIYSDELEV